MSPLLTIPTYRGKTIIANIFDTLASDEEDGWKLLPNDYRKIYESVKPERQSRIVCDFIAGMTDRYALEFFGRLHSENPQSIFKPF